MNNTWKTKNTTVVYDNKWISVEHNEVITPSGNNGIYGVIRFKNIAIGIVPVDEQLNTWVVGQFRYPLNEYSWEIPEGGGLRTVDPLDSAKRELKEETGIEALRWELIQRMHLSNSASDEEALIYLARGLSFSTSSPEETEDLQVKKIPIRELISKVENGEISDSLTVVAALKLKCMMADGKL